MRHMRYLILIIAGIGICTAATSGGQQTSAQATAGAALYRTNCAGCHMQDLGGRNEAPPLAGANFIAVWGSRSTRDLLSKIQTTMPPGKANSLSADDYINLTAFVLASNGASSG